MKVIIAIATFNGRQQFLKQAIKSLAPQADQIRVYDNEVRDIDLTDNGKFYFLQEYKEPVYYFTCDDDIIYPPTYVRDMIEAIERTGTIVTHHGRILQGFGLRYYAGHKAIQCLKDNNYEGMVHISGTGVTAFRTDYFNPVDLWKAEDKKMSDIVFALEAAKQGKKITALKHKRGYFQYQPVPVMETIWGQHHGKDSRQSELADEVLALFPLVPNSKP